MCLVVDLTITKTSTITFALKNEYASHSTDDQVNSWKNHLQEWHFFGSDTWPGHGEQGNYQVPLHVSQTQFVV